LRNQEFDEEYAKIINRFTIQFAQNFCKTNGAINWDKLVQFVSARKAKTVYPLDKR
jgi:hypothetical protein